MLNLDGIDKKIIKNLKTSDSYPSKLSRELKYPRTTISFRLSRLKREDFVESYKKSNITFYKIKYKKVHNKENIKLYKGADDLISAYSQITALPSRSIIHIIQPSEAAKNQLKFLPKNFLKQSQRKMKSKKFVLKAISNVKILSIIKNLEKETLKSHKNRPIVVKLFKNNLFDYSTEIFSSKSFLLISNTKNLTAVVIKNKDTTRLVYDLMYVLFNLSDKIPSFNLNKFVEEVETK